MERDKLCSKIRDYKKGNQMALNGIISQMTPLVKKFARKCYYNVFMGKVHGSQSCLYPSCC